MALVAILKAISLGYLTGLATLSFACLFWRLLRPRIHPALRADCGFGLLSGAFLLNAVLACFIWLGVVNGWILMTTNYFHHLMYGGWSLAISAAGIILLATSLLLGFLHWRRGQAPKAERLLHTIAGLPLRESQDVATISLVGAWRPQLWVNPAFWAGLSTAEKRLALHHERVHVQRRDTQKLLLLNFIGAVYFILPWLRSSGRNYELDSELAVDQRCRRELPEPDYFALVLRAMEHSMEWRQQTVASHLSQRQMGERLELLSEPLREGSLPLAALSGYTAALLSVLPAAALLFNPLSRCLCACYLGY